MNSRERVLQAVNFQNPDRIPIDLGALRASGINAVVYDRLKQRMGSRTPTRIHDAMQILADVEMDVLDRLLGDVVPLEEIDFPWFGKDARPVEKTLFCGQQVLFPPGTIIREQPDGSWVLCRPATGEPYALMPKNGFYFDALRPTMSGKKIDPNLFQPNRTVSDEILEFMRQRADFLYRNTDKAILGWGGNVSMLGLSFLLSDNITQGSLDEWLCMLMVEKQTAHEMMSRFVDAAICKLKLYHQAVGDRCFAWGIASDDAGTQKGELIAPDLFAEMIKPHYKRLCDWVHQNTNWKTFLHSCGSIFHFIEHWIDAGIDILNPVQISAANMQPENLMARYGGKIVFWGGGCDTQHVLPNGTPREIAEHVQHNIQIFGKGPGGYVFNQVHNIQQNVPIENVEALFAAAHEFAGMQNSKASSDSMHPSGKRLK